MLCLWGGSGDISIILFSRCKICKKNFGNFSIVGLRLILVLFLYVKYFNLLSEKKINICCDLFYLISDKFVKVIIN